LAARRLFLSLLGQPKNIYPRTKTAGGSETGIWRKGHLRSLCKHTREQRRFLFVKDVNLLVKLLGLDSQAIWIGGTGYRLHRIIDYPIGRALFWRTQFGLEPG